MKKLLAAVCLCSCLILGTVGLAACGTGEKNIAVIVREASSGTRDAFDGIIKDSNGNSLAKDKDGNKRDVIVKTASILNSTGAVATKVASLATSIGYISLGSLDDTVKKVNFESVEASAANVLNGTYKLQRPFVIMTGKSALSKAAQDFMNYLKSSAAQDIVNAGGYVKQAETNNGTYTAPSAAVNGTITIKGSTSMEKLMQSLIAGYKTTGGEKVSAVTFALDCQGTSFGVSAAKEDTTGSVIGLGSSAVKTADAPSLEYFNIALDAVVIIVNKSNTLTNLTSDQTYKIFSGAVTKFSMVTENA